MIYTVRGSIDKNKLGVTLGHEHFKWETDEFLANNMYFDKVYLDEQIASDFDVILPILHDIKARGASCIVECSPPFGGQNVKLLKKLSEAADLHIIPCTGWNMTKQLYDVFPTHFEEQLANRWIKDFKEGLDTIDGTVIRPGFIKLLLDKGTLSNVDKAMLVAAIRTSKVTGIPIHCHILEAAMVPEVISVLIAEKADFNKFLWAHADCEAHLETMIMAAQKGIWIGIDTVRKGTSQERYNLLNAILELNYEHKVLLSQDYDLYTNAKESGSANSRYQVL